MTQENQNIEACKCSSKKPCLCHKIFGLKGLAIIYKVLSVIVILIMLVNLALGWYDIIKLKLSVWQGVLWSLQIIATFLFYALLLFTVSRVLRVLKKIKHAVNNK